MALAKVLGEGRGSPVLKRGGVAGEGSPGSFFRRDGPSHFESTIFMLRRQSPRSLLFSISRLA
jgi:hypothetical protein